MKSKRKIFLITGGLGFLGQRLIQLLLKRIENSQIIVVDKKKRKAAWKAEPRVKVIYGDLRDGRTWMRLPRNITHLFHLAAVIPWEERDRNRPSIFTDNILPLAHLIEYSKRWPGLKQVIYSSSISVYARTNRFIKEDSPKEPPSIYGAAKLEGEILLQRLASRGIKVASLRYSSLYGSGQYAGTVLPVMLNRALKKKEILVYGSGSRTQDFLYYDDAAEANILAYKKGAGGVFNIGSGTPIAMKELARAISEVFTAGTAKIIRQAGKTSDEAGYKIDISRAKRELNYRPFYRIEDGLLKIKKEMES